MNDMNQTAIYYSEQTTENLVLLTLAGNQNAYEALVVRYEGRVLASAKAIVRSDYMAQDAAQDAFVTAWMKLDTLNAPEKFGIWVSKIAKNSALRMQEKFRDYIDIDSFTGFESYFAVPFEDSLTTGEDYYELHKSINSLTDKVKKVICLYYFEGLSIAQIAAQINVNVGTVKRQLHDGRQKIRKDLCSMDERLDDTLVERVMKKIDELRYSMRRNRDTTAFMESYRPLLEEVEALPESTKKNYALADILQLGWWYSGEQSDEALAKLKEAAISGKNEEAMTTVMAVEYGKLSGKDKIEYMQTVQIPYLEELGFTKTMGYVWFWMGHDYLDDDIMDIKKAIEIFNKTLEILKPEDRYYANAIAALKVCDFLMKNPDDKSVYLSAVAYEFRMLSGSQELYAQPGFSFHRCGIINAILYYATQSINILDCKSSVGETILKNGNSATLLSNTETVETPAGRFDNCELWNKNGFLFYIKPEVGIVKCVADGNDTIGSVVLGEYRVKSGHEKMPFYVGNSWVYVSAEPENISLYEQYEVTYSKAGDRVILTSYSNSSRIAYNENSWVEMKTKLRNDYYSMANYIDNAAYSHNMCADILKDLSKLKELADTPYRKVFASMADGAMMRILTCNPNITDVCTCIEPDCKEVGIWNFFNVYSIEAMDGIKRLKSNNYYHFEWKWWYGAAYMLLHNFMIDELNNCGALWDDEWKPGYSTEKSYSDYYTNIKTVINCSEGGTVTTAAGTFDNCLKVTIDFSSIDDSRNYMNGKKEYYFAKGIGIVKCIHHNGWAVYELTSYEGTGEGYMPLEDGISRHYEGVDFPYGMRGEVDFTCITDDKGKLVMIVDQLGQQNREDWNNSDQPGDKLVKK